MRTVLFCFVVTLALGCTSPESLRLYVLDCGRISFGSPAPFGVSDSETDARQLAVPCYVIEHPNGRLLWNAGMPSELAGKGWVDPPPQTIGDPTVQVRLDRTLADQLSDVSLTMASFDFVALSQMHFDHVGTVNELSGATFLTNETEYDAAFADPVTVPLFNPVYYAGLRETKRLTMKGEHDVFDDGRVRIIPAPGHTPGHQILFIDLQETGPIVLGGDLYFFPASHERQRVPVFNVNVEQTRESMRRVEALLQETGATLWIEHDPATFEGLRKVPEFYQ